MILTYRFAQRKETSKIELSLLATSLNNSLFLSLFFQDYVMDDYSSIIEIVFQVNVMDHYHNMTETLPQEDGRMHIILSHVPLLPITNTRIKKVEYMILCL